ncbi:MAG: cation diffusion facilitator family transporter [Desulfobacterales bacterium]|nr:cation diffusion facilitator family transporter [Desulfobacterales bacterium]MDD4071933.1 cation diffusion facilitator family transporter [Desulfobacterales bacterium]MDD4393767.1 cation diffusion facilitator family transporter [Desulfobacterales bacterium]
MKLNAKSKPYPPERSQHKLRITAIAFSFAIGLILMLAKFYAWFLTGSSAILSDALESIINVVAAAFAMGSILLAAKPPDESHPYGHGKIEFFSAGFEGALIVLAAIVIFHTSISRMLNPQPLSYLKEGLYLLAAAGIINLILGIQLVRTGEKTRSLALYADGKHILTDVYTSGGVLIGLVMVKLTGWYQFDGIIASAAGLNILISGGKLIRRAFAGLMDESDPDLLQQIATLLAERRKDIWIDIHQLRAFSSGNQIHIDFHLILPRNLSLEEAHREAKIMEKIIDDHFHGETSVLIHMDPCTIQNCPICSRNLCKLRQTRTESVIDWNRKTLTANKKKPFHEQSNSA